MTISAAVEHLADVAAAIGDDWWSMRLDGLLGEWAERFAENAENAEAGE